MRLIEGKFPSVHVFAPVVWGLTEDQEILEAVNDINLHIRFGRAVWERSHGLIAIELDLAPGMITTQNIAFACEHIGTAANHFDNELQERFGGSIMFGDARPPKSSHIGIYL